MDSVQNAALSVSEELQRILSSPEFSRSERPSRFLRFVVEQTLAGKADQLKETVIGIEVFGRKPDYDPRSDPVVRIEAAKLRSRLAEYYGASGVNDPLRIEIPKGGYVPQWHPIALARPKFFTRATSRWGLGLVSALAICLTIVLTLRLKGGGISKANAAKNQTLELYMRGRAALDGRTNRTPQALEYFKEAAALSPADPSVLAGTSEALLKMDQEHRMAHEDAFRQAKADAEKAFQLDPDSAEANSALGLVRAKEYRWSEAEKFFRQATELDPDKPWLHQQLGFHLLLPERRMDEAIREIRRAVALDPLSVDANSQLAYALFWAGRLEEAEQQARKNISLDPLGQESYSILGQSLYWKQDYKGALTALQEAVEHFPGGTADHWLACGEVRAGHPEVARRLLADNLPGGRRTNVPNRRLLILYACLGEKEKALQAMDSMYAEGEPSLAHFLLYPELDGLRSDPRFTAMLAKIGLSNTPD